MALIICGHQRSGTSILQRLCDHHPAIMMTNEFGNFFDVNNPFSTYRHQIYKRWWKARNRSFFQPGRQWVSDNTGGLEGVIRKTNPILQTLRKPLAISMLQNLSFVAQYLYKIQKQQRGIADVQAIETALKSIFPESTIVGDKHPDYAFALDKLGQVEGLRCLVIYRDPRDVISSTLKAYATQWGKWWGQETSNAERIAERWLRIVGLIETHAEKIHIIRYEELATHPQPVLDGLSNWLDIDPKGFQHQMVRSDSVGKYQYNLSKQDLADVIRVAGPAMKRLEYHI